MKPNGQIIFYDNDQMMCFDVKHFLWQNTPPDLVDITALTDEIQSFVNSSNITTVAYLETDEEIVKLDPTTMKRIARYNLEKENELLLKEIKGRKKAIAELENKEQVLRNRFAKAMGCFKSIMETGYADDDFDDYELEVF